jgi:hypothetical protein
VFLQGTYIQIALMTFVNEANIFVSFVRFVVNIEMLFEIGTRGEAFRAIGTTVWAYS